ncbi:hypothetical protein BCR34DRAFT_602897 [Clohesyomyces aquaticus]|uniref:Uncharacterized protein n=1 Tax=Clohesyomyces aquaticus TaxID=1231657 RepID=A0A1Y1ZGJ6_9PLEO|nr:hypothetical protein BCR34DRAFT_602897 [Clohesyomyces aquaticus]
MSQPSTPMTGEFMRLPSPSPSAAPSLISSASPPNSPRSSIAKRTPLIEPNLTLKPTLKPPSSKRISKRLSANTVSPPPLSPNTPIPFDNVTSQKLKGDRRRSAAARLSITSLRSLSRSPVRSTAPANRLSTISSSRQISPTTPTPFSPAPSSSPAKSYNPLENYIPCMHSSCSAHYLSTTLSPTFYAPQKPYGLRHKRGLCPAHAYKDLKAANEDCRLEWETLRQNAGRKNLSTVQGEHEAYIRSVDVARMSEGAELEGRLRSRVLGGWEDPNPVSPGLSTASALVALKSGGSGKGKSAETTGAGAGGRIKEEWDWRYIPRPCTRKSCKSPWYSPFSVTLFPFYTAPHPAFGLVKLPTLCPECAKLDVGAAEAGLEKKRKTVKDEEEWEIVLEKVKRDREVEREFWEKAQGRVVKERGVRFRIVEEKKKEPELEGKGFEVLRELCVVM